MLQLNGVLVMPAEWHASRSNVALYHSFIICAFLHRMWQWSQIPCICGKIMYLTVDVQMLKGNALPIVQETRSTLRKSEVVSCHLCGYEVNVNSYIGTEVT